MGKKSKLTTSEVVAAVKVGTTVSGAICDVDTKDIKEVIEKGASIIKTMKKIITDFRK